MELVSLTPAYRESALEPGFVSTCMAQNIQNIWLTCKKGVMRSLVGLGVVLPGSVVVSLYRSVALLGDSGVISLTN